MRIIPPICKRLTGCGLYCEYAVNRFSIRSIIGVKVGKCKVSLLKICIPSIAPGYTDHTDTISISATTPYPRHFFF